MHYLLLLFEVLTCISSVTRCCRLTYCPEDILSLPCPLSRPCLCVQTSVCLCFLFQQHHPSQAPFLRDLTKAYKHIEGHVQPARLWSFTLSITMQRAVGRTVILGIYNCISWLMVNHGVMFFHLLVRKTFPFMTSTLQF